MSLMDPPRPRPNKCSFFPSLCPYIRPKTETKTKTGTEDHFQFARLVTFLIAILFLGTTSVTNSINYETPLMLTTVASGPAVDSYQMSRTLSSLEMLCYTAINMRPSRRKKLMKI